jgi:hypothetical protein
MSDIELPKPIKVKPSIAKYLDDLEDQGKSIFSYAGLNFIMSFSYLYLLNKYKSKCITKSNQYENPFTNIHQSMGIVIPLKVNYTREEESILTEQFKAMSINLVNCIKRGENTIIIPLSYSRGRGGHANILILRINKGELEHFEPHGGEYVGNEKLQKSSKNIMNYFVNILNKELKKNNLKEVKYVDASQVCPYIQGLQDLEGMSKLPRKTKIESGGYCGAWSIFFAELCLKNPDMSSSEILDNIYNYLTTKTSGPNYLKSIIRGYAGLITQQINIYLSIFFKRKITVADLIHTEPRHVEGIVDEVANILIELETYISMNSEFDLNKELKKAMKEYRDLTKGKTKEEQIKLRRGIFSNKKVRNAYYKKRILQNYEEYKRVGRVSEPVFDSPQEISREKIINLDILKTGLLHEKVEEEKRKREEELMKQEWYVQHKLAKEEAKKQRASRKISPRTDKTKTKKNIIPKQIKAIIGSKEKEKLVENIIIKENIDMTTKEGQLKFLKILQELGKR